MSSKLSKYFLLENPRKIIYERLFLFLISLYVWLKAKMTKQEIYLVTLKLING